MHELSIAEHLSQLALQHLPSGLPGTRIRLRIHLGALSCVSADALRFCFDAVAEETPLEGAELAIDLLPVILYCDHCQQVSELSTIQALECSHCGSQCVELRQGRELHLHSIEIEDDFAVSTEK